MQLRPYQNQILRDVEAAFAAGERRVCVQVPTGGGKTVIAAQIVRRLNRRVLYVVPSREIFAQTDAKLQAVGVRAERLAAGFWPRLRRQRVVLAMAQTLQRRMAAVHASSWYPDVIIVDEAHRLLGAHANLLDLFPVPSIALTATPVRLDGQSLAKHWPLLIEGPTVPELQDARALCRVSTVEIPLADMRGVKVRGGDYEQTSLEHKLLEAEADIVGASAWREHLRGRRTVVFCAGIDLSERLVERLRRAGARAVHVDGATPTAKRDGVLRDLAAGRLDVVSNCGLFVEGLDIPNVSGLMLLTSTRSVSKYLQMVGRGMRPASNKPDLRLVDLGGCVRRLGSVEAVRDWGRGGLPLDQADLGE